MRPIATLTIAALAAVALAACSGPGPSTSASTSTSQACSGSTAASGTARAGDTLTLTAPGYRGVGKEDIAVTLVKVVPSASSSEAGFGPSSGDLWVAVLLCVKNLASVPYLDSPNNSLTAVDAAGQNVPAQEDAPTTVGPEFSDRMALTTGNSSSGVVTFELPSGDKIITVQFAPAEGDGTDVGTWTVG
jgi:hypothetical protein